MKEDDRHEGDRPGLSEKLTYFLIGGGIGAILAFLLAPKSGYELRGDIANATRKGIDRSREASRRVSEKATGEYYQGVRDYYGRGTTGAAGGGPPSADRRESATAGGLAGKEDFPESVD